MNKKLIQLLTLMALICGASAHAMDTPEQLGRQLLDAARDGNLALMQQLLQQGAPVDAKNLWSQTPLTDAALGGHKDLCQLLLDHRASVDAKCCAGRTPLMHAALNDHKDTCCLLLNNKSSVDTKDSFGETPLMYAAFGGHTNICHSLIDTIVTQIKNSKANAIVLLGTKRNRRPQYLNDRENNSRIDKPVIQLIARVVHASALRQQESLFEQINAIENNKLKQELLAYAREKLRAKSNNNQGKSKKARTTPPTQVVW